jgi:rhomboid protease GluP
MCCLAPPPGNAHVMARNIGRGIMELAGAGKSGPPLLTFALLTALVVVFGCELALGLDPPTGLAQPSVRTLAAIGGSNRTLVVDNGEWYRMISAPFLHGGLIHLALNGFVLLWVGPVVERLIGMAWFAALYAVSAVAGVVVSLALNPASVVSVGASGALMGLVACLFVVSFHFMAGPVRAQLQSVALRVLVPSLIPIATSVTGQVVDFGAHLGGVLGGALIGLILLGNWPDLEPLPRLRRLAAVLATAGLAAALVTPWMAAQSFLKVRRELEMRAMLMPNSQLPRTDAEWKAQVESLATRYPHDPRPRLFRGVSMLETGDFAGAERELRAGLADAVAVKDLLPQAETLMRTNLAIALSSGKQPAEARTVAGPVCALDTAENRSMRTRLKRIGACD